MMDKQTGESQGTSIELEGGGGAMVWGGGMFCQQI